MPILIAVAFVAAVGVQLVGGFSALGLGTVFVIGAILLMVSQRFLPSAGQAQPAAAEEAGPAADPARTATLDAALDCVITIDGDGTICEWNSAARNTFGRRADEALGRNAGELLVPPALRERYGRMVAGAAGSDDNPLLNRPIEAVAIHAGGAEFPVEISVSKVQDDPDSLHRLRPRHQRAAQAAGAERAPHRPRQHVPGRDRRARPPGGRHRLEPGRPRSLRLHGRGGARQVLRRADRPARRFRRRSRRADQEQQLRADRAAADPPRRDPDLRLHPGLPDP